MKQQLAIHGGLRTVPDSAPVARWPIITEQDRLAIMGVLDRGVFAGPSITNTVGASCRMSWG
jgi:hypothetical protein